MAAIGIHVVRTGLFSFNPLTGTVINKSSRTTTINDVASSEMRHAVIPDSSVVNSADYPTVPDYLKAEAAAGYKLQYMDQTMIVTYAT